MPAKTVRQLFSSAIILLVAASLSVNYSVQPGDLAQDCDGKVFRLPDNSNPQCTSWTVVFYKASTGKKWGAHFGKSREELTRYQESAKRISEKAFGSANADEWYGNASDPICNLCGSTSGKLDAVLGQGSYAKVLDLIERIQIARKLDSLRNWYVKGSKNPYRGNGSLIRTYEENVADAAMNQAKLEATLSKSIETLGSKTTSLISEMEIGLSSLELASGRVDSSYNNLPPEVRSELDGEERHTDSKVEPSTDQGTNRPQGGSCCGYWFAYQIYDVPNGAPKPYDMSNVFRGPRCDDVTSPGALKHVESILGPMESNGRQRFMMKCFDTREKAEDESRPKTKGYQIRNNWAIPDYPK